MAEWVSHLMIADRVLGQLPWLKRREFCVGSIAPDCNIPPANKLEALRGDREGQHSIRVNDQFRICFRAENNEFYDVEIVDYH